MSLLRLSSDKGQGWMHSEVYIESTEVAAITPITDIYSRSNNRTIIALKNGIREHVIEQTEEVAALVRGAGEKPT